MRVSSVILPSASGTLKSTRMKTRLPFRSRSEIDNLFILLMAAPYRACVRSRSPPHKLDHVTHSAAKAPLVVVPGKHFHHAIADRVGQRTIDDRRMRIVEEVGRDQLF